MDTTLAHWIGWCPSPAFSSPSPEVYAGYESMNIFPVPADHYAPLNPPKPYGKAPLHFGESKHATGQQSILTQESGSSKDQACKSLMILDSESQASPAIKPTKRKRMTPTEDHDHNNSTSKALKVPQNLMANGGSADSPFIIPYAPLALSPAHSLSLTSYSLGWTENLPPVSASPTVTTWAESLPVSTHLDKLTALHKAAQQAKIVRMSKTAVKHPAKKDVSVETRKMQQNEQLKHESEYCTQYVMDCIGFLHAITVAYISSYFSLQKISSTCC